MSRTNRTVRLIGGPGRNRPRDRRSFGPANACSLQRRLKMRRVLWIAAVVAICRLPAAARAEEPRGGLVERGRGIVQACFHKKCDRCPSVGPACSSCASSCSTCGQDDARIGKLIDTLFYAPRACDRKNAALRLDEYDWA